MMSSIRSFFIVGSPKTGTSTIAGWLAQHPQVAMSRVKEPGYYSRDVSPVPKFRTNPEYQRLFAVNDPAVKVKCEASTEYLLSRMAIPAIERELQDPLYLAVFRDPVDFMYSWHAQLVKGLHETVDDPAQAWALSARRRHGIDLPPTCRKPMLLDYQEAVLFGKQVARMLQHVDRRRVLFLNHRCLLENPQQAMDQVFQHIDVNRMVVQAADRVNMRSKDRSILMRKSIVSAMAAWRLARMDRMPFVSAVGKSVGRRIVLLNRTASPKLARDRSLDEEIESYVARDRVLLRKLTGIAH